MVHPEVASGRCAAPRLMMTGRYHPVSLLVFLVTCKID